MTMLPKILALIMIVSTMLGAGLQIDRERLVETLRQYGLLGKALLANFVLVPLVAVLLVKLIHVDTGFAIGIVLMSMAPGVPFLANSAGRSGGGSLSFALTIAFFFAALSIVTIPITIALVPPPTDAAHVPIFKFLTTLVVFQLVPLILGALIGPRMAPAAVEKTTKVLHLLFFAATLVFIVLMFPSLASSVSKVYGFGHLLIIACVGLFSVGIGWLLGGPRRDYRRTLSIATLMRNIGLCVLIGTDPVFANTLVLPTIFTYFIITFAIGLPVRIFYRRTKEEPAAA
ncbi:MAG TPA: bile acid:sodium symporter [Candidatus Acidoferrales bacterium]|nr:bile acid:sodium symporter [Candidatus Acidoferrales bacterium]